MNRLIGCCRRKYKLRSRLFRNSCHKTFSEKVIRLRNSFARALISGLAPKKKRLVE
jgi:hypothetical protein